MSRADSPLKGRMIFLVGARRSGTLWLQRILTAHPEISGVPTETHLLSHGVEPLFGRFQHSLKSSTEVGTVYVQREVALDAVRDLCDAVFGEFLEPGASHVLERTPLHALHLELIADIYPDARFVHIIRDGRDVARSMVAQRWSVGPASLEAAAAEWRSAIVAARQAQLPAERYKEVRYERLLDDVEGVVKDLLDWLGLPVTPEIVVEATSEAAIPANLGRAPSGVASGKWREAFTRQDLEAFDAVAGSLLTELGYDRDPPPAARDGRAAPGAPGLAGAVRGWLATRRRREPPARSQGPARYSPVLVGEVLDCLQAKALGRLAELLTDDALIRIVSAQGASEGRGERGRELLGSALESETGLANRQLRGDVYPGFPYAGVVLALEAGGGQVTHRLVFMRAEGQQVAELVLYLLPAG